MPFPSPAKKSSIHISHIRKKSCGRKNDFPSLFIFCKPRSVFSSRLVSSRLVLYRIVSFPFSVCALYNPGALYSCFSSCVENKKIPPPDFSFGKSGSTNAKHRRETHNDKNIFVRTNQFFYASDAQKSLIKKSLKMR